jgi:hypothetical protein
MMISSPKPELRTNSAQILLYYYAPCTRALEQLLLCRTVGGSGDPADPNTDYQFEYLKDDMQYQCRGSEHLPVAVVALVLWLIFAIGFPVYIAIVIGRQRLKHAALRKDATQYVAADYWNSIKPKKEHYWFPVVAHLQVRLNSLDDHML